MTPKARFSFPWIVGALVAVVYVGHGFYNLVFPESEVADLSRRSVEAATILRRVNPYERFLAGYPNLCPAVNDRLERMRASKDFAIIHNSSVPAYPPWALPYIVVTAGLFHPPLLYWLYALLNLVALIFLFRGARQLKPDLGDEAFSRVVVSCLLISTLGMTLGVGQYGVLVLSALIGAALFDQRGKWATAGFFLAFSLIKPNISAPFLLVFLVKRRWPTLIVAGTATALAAAIGCWAIRAWPRIAMTEFLCCTRNLLTTGESPLVDLVASVPGLALIAGPLTSLAVGAVAWRALYRRREESYLILFGLASVAGRVWTYHRYYDNMMLLFLLMALGLRVFSAADRPAFRFAFFAVAASLWPAPRLMLWVTAFSPRLVHLVTVYENLAWIGGALVLYGVTLRRRAGLRAVAPAGAAPASPSRLP